MLLRHHPLDLVPDTVGDDVARDSRREDDEVVRMRDANHLPLDSIAAIKRAVVKESWTILKNALDREVGPPSPARDKRKDGDDTCADLEVERPSDRRGDGGVN